MGKLQEFPLGFSWHRGSYSVRGFFKLLSMSIPIRDSGKWAPRGVWSTGPLWDGFGASISPHRQEGCDGILDPVVSGFSSELYPQVFKDLPHSLSSEEVSLGPLGPRREQSLLCKLAVTSQRYSPRTPKLPVSRLAPGLTSGSGLETGRRIMIFHCSSWRQPLAPLLLIFGYIVQAACSNLTGGNPSASESLLLQSCK